MEVKEAVARARAYLSDLYAEEGIENLGLEEVEFDADKNTWRITLGFIRSWDKRALIPASRSFKVVEIADANGHVLGVRHRATVAI